MTVNIYCYNYNNYYNRKVKKEDTLSGYGEPVHIEQGVNFNFSDGVDTTQVLNTDLNPNYLILVDNNGDIISRWFVIDATYTRNGQHVFNLHRDLVVDNLYEILNADVFIEKATVSEDNPLIFNNENAQLNQIFKQQSLLKDETGCGWYIGYYTKNATDIKGTVATNNIAAETYEILNTPIANWEYAGYTSSNPYIGYPSEVSFKTYAYDYGSTPAGGIPKQGWVVSANTLNNTGDILRTSNTNYALELGNFNGYLNGLINYRSGNNTVLDLLKNYYSYHSQLELSNLINYNRKTVRDSTGKYYRISVTPYNTNNTTINITSGSLFLAMQQVCQDANFIGNPDNESFKVEVTAATYVISYTELPNLATTYDIPNVNKLVTTDQPYNIFAIPRGNLTIHYGNETFQTDSTIADATISAILDQQAEKVYDAQLIGYCPVQNLITGLGEMTVEDTSGILLQASFIIANGQKKGIIFNVPNSQFSLNIPWDLTIGNKKISSICDTYRLIAPDQSNYFDIDAAKNNGISYFNIDIDLRPFNCYIHANPDFKSLYGFDFNTGRGLIYGNNVSLSRALNRYTEYEIQNSQFQNIFDRQIQHIETKNKYQREMETFNAAIGTIAGGLAGAGAGATLGGGTGALVGAGAGTGASLIGGLKDLQVNNALRNEALDYTKDLFGLNLRNIQMQPNTLSKITAINQNNTIFIALEYYTCTDEEKEYLAQKIAWNGMTVGIIGKLNDYINNTWSYNGIESKGYIKGKLIRIELEGEDYHMINSISDELNKGVFIKWGINQG